jgi:uncharacterized coiled-coil DUF342 family protein
VCRRQQEELERRMQERQRDDEQFNEHVGSLKEQAEKLKSKLKKMYATYQAKKSERDSLNEEFQV